MHRVHLSGWGFLLLVGLLPSGPVSGQAPATGGDFQVNTYTTDDQRFPDVAIDADGDFVVAWQSDGQDGSFDGIFGQRYDRLGDAVGSEFQVNTYTTRDQAIVGVAMDDAGGFVVVWTDISQDGASGGIFGRRYASSGGPVGGEFQAHTFTTSLQDNSRVAMDADGDFAVVWQSNGQDGSGLGVFGQLFSSSGAPVGGEFQVNVSTTGSQSLPGLAMDADGDFVVVWASAHADPDRDVFGRRYDSSGSPLGGEFLVNTHTPSTQFLPDVSIDADGDFVVVWASDGQDGSDFGVFGQRFSSAGFPVGGEFQVNSGTAYPQSFPDVAVRSDGQFVVAWSSYRQPRGGSIPDLDVDVVARRFSSSGAPVGGEFQVNYATGGVQQIPAVAIDDTGVFVVAWEDFGFPGDGDAFGVFAARSCGDAYATPESLWPPNHAFLTVELASVSGAAITIDSVFQDEPLGGKVPDCRMEEAGGSVELRAEREGSGNGRVYHVFYSAEGAGGEVCAGELLIGVLDNQGSGGEPIDDGALFESCSSAG